MFVSMKSVRLYCNSSLNTDSQAKASQKYSKAASSPYCKTRKDKPNKAHTMGQHYLNDKMKQTEIPP